MLRKAPLHASAQLISVIRFDFTVFFSQPRWLLLPVAVCLITWAQASQVIRAVSESGTTANMWDAAAAVMVNRFAVWYFLTPLFLYLVSDLIFDRGLGFALQMRTRSRALWWIGKVGAISVLSVVTIMGSLVLTLAISALFLPWGTDWSIAARSGVLDFPIAGPLLRQSPIATAFEACGLIFLGWTVCALIGAVAALRSHHQVVGLAVGFGSYFAGVVVDVILGASKLTQLLPHYQMTLNEIAFRSGTLNVVTILGSLAYFACLTAAVFTMGNGQAHQQDFPVDRS